MDFITTFSSSIITVLMAIAGSIGATLLMFARYREKVDNAEKTISSIQNKVDDLKDRVSRIEGSSEAQRQYFQSMSPVSLTEKGKALFLDSGGANYIEEHKSELIEEIRANKPQTAYDVQEFAKIVLEKQSNKKSFIPLKNFAFKEGKELSLIIQVMAIALRDLALESLGFNLDDLD